MRPFDQLTTAGQTRRLVARAGRALIDDYGLRPARLLARPQTFNRMVRADLVDGSTVAVRLASRHRIHADEVELIERHWLDHLATTSLGTPRIRPDRSGRGSVPLTGIGLEPAPVLTVFSWVPGRRVRKPAGPGSAHRLGRLSARLHLDAAAVSIRPAWQRACRADDPITFGPRDGLTRWRGDGRSLILAAATRCREIIDELWRQDHHRPHLLHGDLGPHNVLVDGRHLTPVDFQDLLWGFDVQDLGISLADFRRAGTSAAAIESFRHGYDEVRPWPLIEPGLADALDAARSLNLINLGLTLGRCGRDDYLARHLADVQRWMST